MLFLFSDRVSLLWTWFTFLAAYVCQLLMAIGLVIGTNKVRFLLFPN